MSELVQQQVSSPSNPPFHAFVWVGASPTQAHKHRGSILPEHRVLEICVTFSAAVNNGALPRERTPQHTKGNEAGPEVV